jgi:plasmid stabilization system protein ParE
MEDFKFFSHDDDERAVDETMLAGYLLAAPQDLDPEMSLWGVVLCSLGDIFAAGMLLATLKTLWTWLVWSNLLLLFLQLVLIVGTWVVLLTWCTVKLVMDQQHKEKNRHLRAQRQRFQQAWFEELLASKRDARLRKNKALQTELTLRQTRLPANKEGNRDALYDPHTGQVLLVPGGNFVQPVPHTFHYHHVVPAEKVTQDHAKEGLPAPEFPPPITFEQILRSFVPTRESIYLFNTVNGPIIAPMHQVCHVGLAAPTGGGKCVQEDEPIFLADGRVVPAKTLIGKRVEVIGVTDTTTMQQKPVLASFAENGVRAVIEIELENGVVLKRTEEHLFWAAQADGHQHGGLDRKRHLKKFSSPPPALTAGWVQAKDLQVCGTRPNGDGHMLLCPTSIQQQGTRSRSDAEVVLCAVLLTEGGLRRPAATRLRHASAEMGAVVQAGEPSAGSVASVALPTSPAIDDRLCSTVRRDRGGQVIPPVRAWEREAGSAMTTCLPEWVFQLPHEQIALFLRVLVDRDGWFEDGSHGCPSVQVCLATAPLAQQIGQLALRLGITETYRYTQERQAPAWCWSSPLVEVWQEKVGSEEQADQLARAVRKRRSQQDPAGKGCRQGWPRADQTGAACPAGYQWRTVKAMRSSVAPTVSIEVHDQTHAFVGYAVEHNTNTTRLLTAQFERAGAQVYLASPNFAQVKLNQNHLEDWRPIVQHLAAPPAQTEQEIARLLHGFRTLLENRKRQEQGTPRRGQDVYLILGEWPGIVARVKDAPQILELLLRESRQYGIHIVTEFQDALVKTLGVSSGVRENLLHCYYFGGDLTTARVLLNLKKGESLNETGLGKQGAAYLRANEQTIVAGRVPHCTNRALYLLLGTPPDPLTDDEMTDESHIPETYYHVDEHGRYVDGGTSLDQEQEDDQTKTARSFSMPGRPRGIPTAETIDRPQNDFPHQEAVPGSGKPHQLPTEQLGHTSRQAPPMPELPPKGQERDAALHFPKVETGQLGAEFQPLLKPLPTTEGETAETADQGKYKFSETERPIVIELYKAYGNLDEVLRHFKRGARWQKDASRIVREAGLL